MDRPVGRARWGVVSATAVLAGAAGVAIAGSGAWFFVVLTEATLGNVLAIVALVSRARGRRDRVTATLFAGNVVLVFGLAGAAAVLEQTFAAQLGEQPVSTAAQAMFMWASIRLAASVSAQERHPDNDSMPTAASTG